MNALLKELKSLKAKQKSLQKEGSDLMQRIEHLEQLAQENNGVEAETSIKIALKKASLRRGYK